MSVRRTLFHAVALVMFACFAVSLWASGGPSMPWDEGLVRIVDNLKGTVARMLILAAIVIAGVMWAFTEHSTGARRVSQIIFGGAAAMGATSFLVALGFTAAVV